MYRFILRRILVAAPTMLAVATLVFIVSNVVPGDVVTVLYGMEATPFEQDVLRARMGLNLPVHVRYLQWLSNVLSGNLGRSLSSDAEVMGLIAYRLPITLTLASTSILISLAIAVPVGVVSAVKRNTKTDLTLSVLAIVALSVPGFYLAIVGILVFSVWLGVLPPGGFVHIYQDPVASLLHLAMPATTLGAILAAYIMRMTRSSLLDVLSQDFILALRAKGLPERIVLYRHALKNSMIPVVTAIGLQMGVLLGGSIVIEQVFLIGGIGTLLLSAVIERDFIIVQGVVLIYALLIVLTNLIVDIVYMYLDPRIRFD